MLIECRSRSSQAEPRSSKIRASVCPPCGPCLLTHFTALALVTNKHWEHRVSGRGKQHWAHFGPPRNMALSLQLWPQAHTGVCEFAFGWSHAPLDERTMRACMYPVATLSQGGSLGASVKSSMHGARGTRAAGKDRYQTFFLARLRARHCVGPRKINLSFRAPLEKTIALNKPRPGTQNVF